MTTQYRILSYSMRFAFSPEIDLGNKKMRENNFFFNRRHFLKFKFPEDEYILYIFIYEENIFLKKSQK